MMDNKISIKFEFTDENKNFYSAESRVEVFDEITNVLDELGMAFNNFLKQAGYTYFDKEYLLMKSLDGEEYEVLDSYLKEYRKKSGDDACSEQIAEAYNAGLRDGRNEAKNNGNQTQSR